MIIIFLIAFCPQALIDFIYSGEIKLNQENVQDVLISADMIELKEVVEKCTEFLKLELHESNAIGKYSFIVEQQS